ncbi:ATP-binding protein [Vulcanisaeta sp. JCM 16161]|uniref:AAA family ATPase n=1 Tax=Vulcanisaeta sp. JCM 16161 TaxID=1295372 RepID=UPI0006CFE4E7|nr:ATP-binding protein [Vulcanisaeta sp. JCM 16161]
MAFLDRPAEDPSELYDREAEIKQLRFSALNRAVTLVVGFRRVGKTSLVKAATKDIVRVYIDARRFEGMAYMTVRDFLNEFAKSLSQLLPFSRRLIDFLSRVRGLSIMGLTIEFSGSARDISIPSLFDALNDWALSEGKHLVVIIDEVQELSRMRGFNLLPVFAYVYDNLRNISFIFAGSKVGMLYNYLRLNNPDSPLYGRYMEVIELRPFTREQSLDFLRRGFDKAGIAVSENIIDRAVDELDGVVGWLSLFGLTYISNPGPEALNRTISIASGIVEEEFCNFVRAMGSRRYVLVINALKQGATWSEVKRYLELREGRPISDSEVTKLLRRLVDNGFIMKVDNQYVIADPILRRISDRVRCRDKL